MSGIVSAVLHVLQRIKVPEDHDPTEDGEFWAALESQFVEGKAIMIVQQDDTIPMVKWDPELSEADVVVSILKALLWMVLDDVLSDMFDPPS